MNGGNAMNRKLKKMQRERLSTRQLMGITKLTDHGIKTANGELIYYLLKPDNLSVLSKEDIRGRVLALQNILCRTEHIRLIAMDSRESFQQNKEWYQNRCEQEQVSEICALLRDDAEHLDDIQTNTASAREFAIVYSYDKQSEQNDPGQLFALEKNIRDCGFRVHLANAQDIKRILAVYYQQDVTTESFPDYDGGEYVAQ